VKLGIARCVLRTWLLREITEARDDLVELLRPRLALFEPNLVTNFDESGVCAARIVVASSETISSPPIGVRQREHGQNTEKIERCAFHLFVRSAHAARRRYS
jgi:hypothetical protein